MSSISNRIFVAEDNDFLDIRFSFIITRRNTANTAPRRRVRRGGGAAGCLQKPPRHNTVILIR